jgi:hypothetical protein
VAGEVYRARDTKLLGRWEILPMHSHQPDRWRFRWSTGAVAALNHPHIVTIFSIEEHDVFRS